MKRKHNKERKDGRLKGTNLVCLNVKEFLILLSVMLIKEKTSSVLLKSRVQQAHEEKVSLM